ncbi:MAG: hypothetical protein O7J95_20835 [Planctomycetota bacterium]|nr:hypothetical protein [Planctomycetota bacterium]
MKALRELSGIALALAAWSLCDGAEVAGGFEVREDDERIRIVGPLIEASIRKKGYVSGVEGGSFLDRTTGCRDLGFGLDIVDWLMEPGSDESYRDQLPGDLPYRFDNLVHGKIPKRSIEGPQICTKARELAPRVLRGEDFVAVTMSYRYHLAAPGKKSGSLWEQTIVFPEGERYFISCDRITSANASDALFLRIDMPGHLKHREGDTFSEIYLSYGGRIPADRFLQDFPPDARFLYRRDDDRTPGRFIRAYRIRKPGSGEPGPWLAGMTLDPSAVHEAWCHQRGYVCFIEEFGGRPVRPGESFSAAFVVGFFDSIEEMHRVYDRYAGANRLLVDERGWRLERELHPSRASAGKPIDVGLEKQLLVDDHVLAGRSGVRRELGRVTKAAGGRPIFTDGWFYGTVLHDENRFKMWYRKTGRQGYGYAESRDGLRFERKADVQGIPFAGDVNLAVELDPHETDPAHRFKAGFDAPGMAAGLAHSADGIHWTAYNDGRPVTFRAADTYNQILWDETTQVYRLFTRTDFGTGGGPLARTAAPDFEVRGTRVMVNPDVKADPTGWKTASQWWLNREGPMEYRRRQIYAATVWIHHGVHFLLMSVYEHPADVSEGRETDRLRRHERDVMNFYIATSRDGSDWDLRWVYAGEPLVPRGPDGAFDKDIVLSSSTVVTHADRHWLYYAGGDERHGTAETRPPVTFERRHAIGLATLRLDGFVALAATDEPAIVETKPFRLEGNHLEVNVDARDGAARLEVLDGRGEAIAGFSGEAAPAVRGIDDVRWRPRWRGKDGLSELRGRTVRLRFRLRRARLYAFQVVR